jgi:hypothetical protein
MEKPGHGSIEGVSQPGQDQDRKGQAIAFLPKKIDKGDEENNPGDTE